MQPPEAPAIPAFGRPFRRGGTDRSVQGTNDDAQLSKLSCVQLGYFKDDFVKHFVKKPCRRPPLINRGYYSRVAALQELVRQFLGSSTGPDDDEASAAAAAAAEPRQLLVLGAGYDTLFFTLQSSGVAPHRYYEVDFPVVTKAKSAMIGSTPELRSLLDPAAEVNHEEGSITSERYCLIPADLRDLPAFKAKLEAAGFDFGIPTLVLSECVLVYMEPQYSRALVGWAGENLRDAVFIVYEQIHPDDAFGQQMLINLESRGCPLKGLHDTPDLEAQKQRFLGAGWDRAEAFSMDDIYRRFLDKTELRRIERLEIFDEFEEWHMIQGHYCIAVGVNDSQGFFKDFGFKEAAPLKLPGPPRSALRGMARGAHPAPGPPSPFPCAD